MPNVFNPEFSFDLTATAAVNSLKTEKSEKSKKKNKTSIRQKEETAIVVPNDVAARQGLNNRFNFAYPIFGL